MKLGNLRSEKKPRLRPASWQVLDFHVNQRVGPAPQRNYSIQSRYQSFCPFVGIGSPNPLRECVSPLDPKGGEATLPCGWGGTQSGRLERKLGTLYIVLYDPDQYCPRRTWNRFSYHTASGGCCTRVRGGVKAVEHGAAAAAALQRGRAVAGHQCRAACVVVAHVV